MDFIQLLCYDDGFREYFFSFQSGTRFANYKNGDYACRKGYTYLVARQPKLIFTENAQMFAAIGHHMEILQIFYYRGQLQIEKIMPYIIQSRDDEIFEWFRHHFRPRKYEYFPDHLPALRRGKPEHVAWFLSALGI